MLIPFGILSAGGAGGDYELIETKTLASAASSVVFTNLEGYATTYKHLQIRYVVKSARAGTNGDGLTVRFNGDTGTNYSRHALYSDNGTVGAYGVANQTYSDSGTTGGANTPALTFGGAVLDILNAYGSVYKTLRTLNGLPASGFWVSLISGSWRSTATISSISVQTQSGANITANSRFSLYGIRG